MWANLPAIIWGSASRPLGRTKFAAAHPDGSKENIAEYFHEFGTCLEENFDYIIRTG